VREDAVYLRHMNVLAHGYTEIRLDRVWQAIVDDLPALKTVVDEGLNG
jgi:uncharacterized protein with HEPN domain